MASVNEVRQDLRFTEEENQEDAHRQKPISSIPHLQEKNEESVKTVNFGVVQFNGKKGKATDSAFDSLTEKIKQGFLETSSERGKKNAVAKVQKPEGLMKPSEILNRGRQKSTRSVAADSKDIQKGSEFIFHSMCKHIDSYEKSNAIDLGTTICPGQ